MDAESVVVKNGQRLMTFRAPHSALLLVDWELHTQALVRQVAQRVELHAGGLQGELPEEVER
jgi:hypothetical protein